MNKNFQTFDTMWKPRQIGSKTLKFEMIEEKKILKIEDTSGNEVYLGWEYVSKVWSLESIFRYRLSYSSGSNFKHFYEDVIRAVAEMSGDVKINIYNIINRLSEKSDDNSEIGLRHYLDTINKYIKDCSDSDTSSSSYDKEECKAVEQNGEDSKTTKEE
ncbi:hypothetical protein FQA39_LY17673 [Lamprigera yunnana]|nr:hypothetical protein FQA39_LY17673 [Lamprigera yunnana]